MKVFEYVYRDRKLGCGSNPIYNTIDKEHMSEGVKRELLKLTDATKKKDMADLELLYIGTYDDVTLKHECSGEPELLVTCGDFIVHDGE